MFWSELCQCISANDAMLRFHQNPQQNSSKLLLGSVTGILFTAFHKVLLKVVWPVKTLSFNKHLPATAHGISLTFSHGGKVATLPFFAEVYFRLFRLDIKP